MMKLRGFRSYLSVDESGAADKVQRRAFAKAVL